MIPTLFVLFASAAYIITAILLTPEKKPREKETPPIIDEVVEYEQLLFRELCKAWLGRNEKWLVSEYTVPVNRISW